MPRLRIDDREVEVKPGDTLLEAARSIGIDIPTLCHVSGVKSGGSCMVCAVKDRNSGFFLPACTALALDGMEIESESDEVFLARKTALELLLSDHLGDCLSPCQRVCPANMRIPIMLEMVRYGRMRDAALMIREDLPFAAALCRACHRPCESGCRRRQHDEPVAIAALIASVLEREEGQGAPLIPAKRADKAKSVAVVGAGPAGLAAAYYLLLLGYTCSLVEGSEVCGGSLRLVSHAQLPPEVLENEIEAIQAMGGEFRLSTRITNRRELEALMREFHAVLLTPGRLDAAAVTELGLASGPQGISVRKQTFETSIRGVFAAGHATRKSGKIVHAAAQGKAAAHAIDQFISGFTILGQGKTFSCALGRLKTEEMEAFVKEANPGPRQSRDEIDNEFDPSVLVLEAERCVQCNCAVVDDCKLRELAARYGASAHRFSGGRRSFVREMGHPHVIFEPGKCIRCGNCIVMAQEMREPLGLTFIGRGFDVRVGVPLDRELSEGLRKAAEACAAVCPTGAIILKPLYRDEHRNRPNNPQPDLDPAESI